MHDYGIVGSRLKGICMSERLTIRARCSYDNPIG